MPRRTLGEFALLLMLAVYDLGDDQAYGVPIQELIERRTGRRVSPGAVYTALERLSLRGLVSSTLGSPTPERGGRRKRYYRLTAAGTRALRESLRTTAAMSRPVLQPLGLTPGSRKPR